ncbi:hypothetical protein ACHRV6_22680 [Flavobacterium sp. FlaQc-51]|jgi:hypothetical protein|uniref:hypothetical protein n=1 Tax=Flavobacterium sp. FlaQc-51 TaxID=3374184 RepID=UPI003757C263
MKEKNKVQSSNSQLSIEFSKPLANEKMFQAEMGKVIRLSEHGSLDKSKIDYSKLVIKNTKSF